MLDTGVRHHSGQRHRTSSAPQRKQRWHDFMFKASVRYCLDPTLQLKCPGT